MEKNKKRENSILSEYVAPVINGSVGGIIGASIVGPWGAILGAIAGTTAEKVFVKIGEDVAEQKLSKTEHKKVGCVVCDSIETINEKLNSGQAFRKDDFYTALENDRSAAEELLEGTLFAAQKEHEEKKLKYMANLYANINFDEKISRSIANQLVKLSSSISYREIVMLSVIGKANNKLSDIELRDKPFNGFKLNTDFSLAAEIFELYRMSLINSSEIILDANSFTPAKLFLSGVGELLYTYMELENIDDHIASQEIVCFLCNESDEYSDPEIVGRLAIENKLEELENNVVYFDDMDDVIEEKMSDKVPQKQFNSAMATLEAEKAKSSKASKVYSNIPIGSEGPGIYVTRK